jgi:hypothetical protein
VDTQRADQGGGNRIFGTTALSSSVSPRRQLAFVYNADGGTWNLLVDAAHKVLSPRTYGCSLCALTYGPMTMRRAWAAFVRDLPHDVRFLHRDDLRRETPGARFGLPALLERSNGEWVVLLDNATIDRCRTLDELIAAVRGALAT